MFIELSEEDGSGGEEEGEGGRDDRGLKAQQTKLEAEKQAILQNKELLEEVISVHYHYATHSTSFPQRKEKSSSQKCSSM